MDAMEAVTEKLQDVTYQCDKVTQEAEMYKKANKDLKEENDLLLRENQRLRLEMSSRSQQRFGRTTVDTLQSQIDTNEKKEQQLDDLEKEIVTFEAGDGGNISLEKGKEDVNVTEDPGDCLSRGVKEITFCLPQDDTPKNSQAASFGSKEDKGTQSPCEKQSSEKNLSSVSSKVTTAVSGKPEINTTSTSSELSQLNNETAELLATSLIELEHTLALNQAYTANISTSLNCQLLAATKSLTVTTSVFTSLPRSLPFQTDAKLSSVPVYAPARYVDCYNPLNPSYFNNSTSSRSSLPTYATANSTFCTSVNSPSALYCNRSSTGAVPVLEPKIYFDSLGAVGSDPPILNVPPSKPEATVLSSSILSSSNFHITPGNPQFPSDLPPSALNVASPLFDADANHVLPPTQPALPISPLLDVENPNNFNSSLNITDMACLVNSLLPQPPSS